MTFNFFSVKYAKLHIPSGSGCGGWCAQVAIVRNGEDCKSRWAPANNCKSRGFSSSTVLTAYFNKDCTALKADAREIRFRLHTPVGGSYSDWCTNFVKFKADYGVKSVFYDTPVDYGSLWWVGQGSYAKVYYSFRIHGRDPYWMHFD